MLLNPTDRYLEKKGRREGKREGMREGMREGNREGKLELAKKLIDDGHSIDYVAKLSGLSKESILKSK